SEKLVDGAGAFDSSARALLNHPRQRARAASAARRGRALAAWRLRTITRSCTKSRAAAQKPNKPGWFICFTCFEKPLHCGISVPAATSLGVGTLAAASAKGGAAQILGFNHAC